MLSSLSSAALCTLQTCKTDIQQILNRIIPISYTTELLTVGNDVCPSSKGTLLVDSNQFIYGQLYFQTCSGEGVGTIINGDNVSTSVLYANTIYTQDLIGLSGGSFGGPTGSIGPGHLGFRLVAQSTSFLRNRVLQIMIHSGHRILVPTQSLMANILGQIFI